MTPIRGRGDRVHGKRKVRGRLMLKFPVPLVASLYAVWQGPDMLSAQEKPTPKMVLSEQLVNVKDVIEDEG
jgi:hypothetical protein